MFQALVIYSEEGLKLETSASETLFGGKFYSITQFVGLSVCRSVCLSVCQSICSCVCTFIQLLSFYLSLTLLFPSVHSPTPQFYPKFHL